MNSVESSLYTVAMALCGFAAGILRGRSRPAWSFSWLTWFLVIESGVFSLELLMAHPAVPLKGLWLGLRLGSSLLVAPCLWLAVREITTGVRPHWRELGRGPLLAIAGGLILTVPLIENAHLGVTYANPLEPTSSLHSRLIHTTMLGCIGIFAVQAPWFLWRCRAALVGQARQRGDAIRWLQLPLLVVATTWMLGLLRTVQCATHAPRELALVLALADVGVTVGSVYVLIRRMPFAEAEPSPPAATVASAPVVSEPVPVEAVASEPAAAAPVPVPAAPYARSRLDEATRRRIKGRIERALGSEQRYRDSLLNLRSFSQGLKEKPHYVSQVINQELGASFYELVNRHRIERAKQLLAAGDGRSVLEIALEVGFNSKSTFNTAFRKHTGVTPTDFRAQNGASERKNQS
jgi:AraC-like DNA-binding protein